MVKKPHLPVPTYGLQRLPVDGGIRNGVRRIRKYELLVITVRPCTRGEAPEGRRMRGTGKAGSMGRRLPLKFL